MKRITVRLPELQYQILDAFAQELGTDISSAFRSILSSHERTQKLLHAIDDSKTEILIAVEASREAADQARTTAVEIGNKHLTNLKALADWLSARLPGDKT